jgi:hypothetical protein
MYFKKVDADSEFFTTLYRESVCEKLCSNGDMLENIT